MPLTFTLTFYWWHFPILLVLAAFVLFWMGSRKSGMLGGVIEDLIAIGLLIGALISLITGLLA